MWSYFIKSDFNVKLISKIENVNPSLSLNIVRFCLLNVTLQRFDLDVLNMNFFFSVCSISAPL